MCIDILSWVVRTCLIAPIKLGKEAGGESGENDGGEASRHVSPHVSSLARRHATRVQHNGLRSGHKISMDTYPWIHTWKITKADNA